jgi:hypothetical protein
MKKFLVISVAVAVVILLALQFFRLEIDNPPVTGDLEAPQDVKAIFMRACYDCHSNATNIRWYDKIQPVYWQVAADVREGRKGLNFSHWDQLAPGDRKAKLWEAVNQIEAGAMPISSYQIVHPESKVSKQELSKLKAYLLGQVHSMPNDTAKLHYRDKQLGTINNEKQNDLPVSLNGITYIPDYKNWQVISTSDRFDNGTIRVIYGNSVAVNAVKHGKNNPWPDGAIFAKAAWDKLDDGNGHVTAGAFKQVEFMIKDAKKYKATNGWGFARFKTPKLTPYGKTAMFTTECINCHKPMKDNDLVFTFPIKN